MHEAIGDSTIFGKDIVAYVKSLTAGKPISNKLTAEDGLSIASTARCRLCASITKPARNMQAGIHSFTLAQYRLDQAVADQVVAVPTILQLYSPAYNSEFPLHSYTNLFSFAAKLPDGTVSPVIEYVPGLHPAFVSLIRELRWGTSTQASCMPS